MNYLELDDIFNDSNLDLAMNHLLEKRDSCGVDGIMITQFQEFWALNRSTILQQIYDKSYTPNLVQEIEIVSYNGKKRMISLFTSTDRFILRAITQVLQPLYDKILSNYCFSYRENYGTLKAVQQAAKYIQDGYICVAEIDIAHFFDNILLHRIEHILTESFQLHDALFTLIQRYLYTSTEFSGTIRNRTRGLIQGSPLSPLLSNLYLTQLDFLLETEEYRFIRFGDDINVYTKTMEDAGKVAQLVYAHLDSIGLEYNRKKSGIHQSQNRTYLGYEFQFDRKSEVLLVQRIRNHKESYHTWHKTAIQKVDRNFHLINDGILTKRDYTILFENNDGKKYLPVETIDSVNAYSDITFTSNFFQFVSGRRIKVCLFDKYGNYTGHFTGINHGSSGKTMLKQAALYLDTAQRLSIAQSIIIAGTHNIRANLRYYYKQSHDTLLNTTITNMSEYIIQMNEAHDINQLLLIEARARQCYYHAFNSILHGDDFTFTQRTKRPPKDPLNAMISFGNVFLYNRLSTEIYKTSLDIKIGFLHSTNNRAESLNLDIAEIFKPIIVDRVIFTLINKKMITPDGFFETVSNQGIYLNKIGKRLFIEELEKKLYQKIKINNELITYDMLMRKEIQKVLRLVLYNQKYKPYKYIS